MSEVVAEKGSRGLPNDTEWGPRTIGWRRPCGWDGLEVVRLGRRLWESLRGPRAAKSRWAVLARGGGTQWPSEPRLGPDPDCGDRLKVAEVRRPCWTGGLDGRNCTWSNVCGAGHQRMTGYSRGRHLSCVPREPEFCGSSGSTFSPQIRSGVRQRKRKATWTCLAQRLGFTAAPVRGGPGPRAPSVSWSWCLGAQQVSCLSGTEARPSRGPRDGMLSAPGLCASRFEVEEPELWDR